MGQEFQVGKAGKKGPEGRVGRVGQVGQVRWCVKVWEGGPEGSGEVNRKFLFCAFSVGVFINDQLRLFAETVYTVVSNKKRSPGAFFILLTVCSV